MGDFKETLSEYEGGSERRKTLDLGGDDLSEIYDGDLLEEDLSARFSGYDKIVGLYLNEYDVEDARGGALTFRSELIDARFYDCRLEGSRFLNDVEDSNFRDSSLRDVQVGSSSEDRINLSGTRFTETNLFEARFENVRGTEVSFKDASGRDVEFNDVRFYEADFREVDFGTTNEARALEISDSKFRDSEFLDADFRRAYIRDTEFTDCSMRGIKLHGANLSGVKFRGCNLLGAQITPETSISWDTQFDNCRLPLSVLAHPEFSSDMIDNRATFYVKHDGYYKQVTGIAFDDAGRPYPEQVNPDNGKISAEFNEATGLVDRREVPFIQLLDEYKSLGGDLSREMDQNLTSGGQLDEIQLETFSVR